MNNIENYISYENYVTTPGVNINVTSWDQHSNSFKFNDIIIIKYPKEETTWDLAAVLKFIQNHSKAIVVDTTLSSVFTNLYSFNEMETNGEIMTIPLPMRNFDYAEICQYSAILQTGHEIGKIQKKFVIVISASFEKWSLLAAGKFCGLSLEDFERELDRQSSLLLEGPFRHMFDLDKKWPFQNNICG